jgi:N-acetylglucosamine-6-phosphate deacetylase
MKVRWTSMIQGFKNVQVLTPQGMIKTNLHIKDGKIEALESHSSFDGMSFDEEVTIIPGFIDQHIHGVNEADTMDGTEEALLTIAKSLAAEGTTSFLPTTMTQSVEAITKALENIASVAKQDYDGAEIIGVHLEGPYINKAACGAQPSHHIVNPTINQFESYHEASGGMIKLVTLAPEVDGGQEFIQHLKSKGIVASIGHTIANYESVVEAIKNGASQVTHCFNAMTGLHHREVGVVGATLLHDELKAEAIVDGVHVHERAVSLLYKNKGKEKMLLVTDSMRAKGLPDGDYDLGGQNVHVNEGIARLEGGTLAGSTLSMIDAVRNSMKFLNISLEEAVYMASTTPAINLGVVDRKGSIEVGKDADLVVLDKNHRIVMTICKGKIVYRRGNV